MNFDETISYGARAEYCRNQASMTEDARLKDYWNDLARSWDALDITSNNIENHINSRVMQSR